MEGDHHHRQTYWCYECDLSVALFPSPYPVCPDCRNDDLELMDSHHFQAPNPNSNPNILPSLIPSAPAATTSDLNLISTPNLRQLIQQLTDSNNNNNPIPSFSSSISAPTSKAFIDSIPTVNMSEMFPNEQVQCPICKDRFLVENLDVGVGVGMEAKQLPCSHVYHSECILPWLEQRNSCPVCRFKMPVEVVEDGRNGGGIREVSEARFWEMVVDDEDDDEVANGFERTLMHFARRYMTILEAGSALRSVDSSFVSASRMVGGEAETAMIGPANSVETVWSGWHWERGVDSNGTESGGGGGGGMVGSGGGGVGLVVDDEDCDAVASGIEIPRSAN